MKHKVNNGGWFGTVTEALFKKMWKCEPSLRIKWQNCDYSMSNRSSSFHIPSPHLHGLAWKKLFDSLCSEIHKEVQMIRYWFNCRRCVKKDFLKKMMKRKHLSRPRHQRGQTKIANKNWTFQFHAFWRQVVPWSSWWYPQEKVCWRTLSGNLALEPYSPPNLPKEPSLNYPQNLPRTPYNWLTLHDILLWKPREWCVFCILYPFTFEID